MLVDEAVTRGADALGIAGGDGSLAVVAAAARAHRLPFVCVPAGTRNHFALDLGVDRDDLVGSLEAFPEGVERVIDVAEVNGRLFLNNVSLGIYGDAVQHPAYRGAKAQTLLQTAAQVLGPSSAGSRPSTRGRPWAPAPAPRRRARLEQPYAFEPPPARGTRPALDGGTARRRRPRPAEPRPKPGPHMDHDASRSDRARADPRRHRRRGGRASAAARVRDQPAALRVRISARQAFRA